MSDIETVEIPKSLEEVIANLKGFGLEDNEEILTFVASGKTIQLRISNIPTTEEMAALFECENSRGYAWIQQIRAEILSRAITWIDGVSIRNLEPINRFVPDPTDPKKTQRDIQVVLRNVLLGWGQEITMTLWKILMVHSDKIERRLREDFPDSTILTDAEQRLMANIIREIEDSNKDLIKDVTTETLIEEDKDVHVQE